MGSTVGAQAACAATREADCVGFGGSARVRYYDGGRGRGARAMCPFPLPPNCSTRARSVAQRAKLSQVRTPRLAPKPHSWSARHIPSTRAQRSPYGRQHPHPVVYAPAGGVGGQQLRQDQRHHQAERGAHHPAPDHGNGAAVRQTLRPKRVCMRTGREGRSIRWCGRGGRGYGLWLCLHGGTRRVAAGAGIDGCAGERAGCGRCNHAWGGRAGREVGEATHGLHVMCACAVRRTRLPRTSHLIALTH